LTTSASTVETNDLDQALMRRALALADGALGTTWPNPAVGCVLARDGRVVAEAATGQGGRPHAEQEVLRVAGAAARGCTAYVTLEPCAHHGQTPPCADALIEAEVARVVVACPHDPDPRVEGRGLARLREAGIRVDTGLLEAEARHLNEGFFARVQRGWPWFTLKLASSLDGRIATALGESRWITGEAARERVQRLRARHDAVMVGSGTALADDPSLLCRLPEYLGRPGVRIVVDSRLRLPASSRLVATAGWHPTWILTRHDAQPRALANAPGLRILPCLTGPDGTLDPAAMARTLGEAGLTRILVEGGGQLAASLLRDRLVDELVWHRAPMILGSDGRPAVGPMLLDRLAKAPQWRCIAREVAGDDTIEVYRPEINGPS
jgi:diaminohydroxyphosphoribosylaminopyrimidine deaminase/5-amino-6-(5-phosphoribosylamino)uracil reductase